MRSAGFVLFLLTAGSMAVAGFWQSEILVDTSSVSAFDAVADSSGVIWTTIAHPDGAVGLYRSDDFGATWQRREVLRVDSGVSKLQLCCGQGDSSFLYIFLLNQENSGDLWLARTRIGPDSGGFSLAPVAVGPDTVDDFSAALDRDDHYYLYCLYVNEHRTGRTGTLTRSLDYGVSWEAGTDWWNAWDPCVSYTNGSTVHCAWRYALNGGEIHYSCNRHYAMSGYWSTHRVVSDTFAGQCFDPAVVQADSSPESRAAVWVFYTAGRRDTAVLDLEYSASSDGGSSWTPGLPFGNSFRDEQQPYLAVDMSGPNDYVSLCYSFGNRNHGDTVAAWWTCANSLNLTGWLEPVRISRHPLAALPPKLIYVPHAPMRLPGLLYSEQSDTGPRGVWFAAPWLSSFETPAADSQAAAPSLRPNPATGMVQFGATVTRAGSYSLTVYDASGRLVSSVFQGRLECGPWFWTWDRKSQSGRRIPAGTFFVRLRGPGTCSTRRLVLL
ncbi:hypothetical protein JXD38_00070 [candidate division WOR-3 bacterium]|nr:hypothetical protein [candidate division WOR-3 bacterium]